MGRRPPESCAQGVAVRGLSGPSRDLGNGGRPAAQPTLAMVKVWMMVGLSFTIPTAYD